MSHVISPVALATTALVANQVSLQVAYVEKLIRPYCVNSSSEPSYSIVYTTGTPKLVQSTVFVPVQAKITLVSPNKCRDANIQVVTENFMVAFQGQTAVPTSVMIASVGRISNPSAVKCCTASEITIHDSLTATIA